MQREVKSFSPMSLFMPDIAVVLIAVTDGTDGTGELKTSNANNGGWWLDSKHRCRLWGVFDLSSGSLRQL